MVHWIHVPLVQAEVYTSCGSQVCMRSVFNTVVANPGPTFSRPWSWIDITFLSQLRGHLLQQWLQEWPHRVISFYSTGHSRWKEVSSTKLQFKDRENPTWRWILDAVLHCWEGSAGPRLKNVMDAHRDAPDSMIYMWCILCWWLSWGQCGPVRVVVWGGVLWDVCTHRGDGEAR